MSTMSEASNYTGGSDYSTFPGSPATTVNTNTTTTSTSSTRVSYYPVTLILKVSFCALLNVHFRLEFITILPFLSIIRTPKLICQVMPMVMFGFTIWYDIWFSGNGNHVSPSFRWSNNFFNINCKSWLLIAHDLSTQHVIVNYVMQVRNLGQLDSKAIFPLFTNQKVDIFCFDVRY